MKKLFLLLAVLATASCQTKQNGASDALSFGLLGDVKEVYVTRTVLSTTDEEVELTDEPGAERLEFTYDADGRITLDTYGNVYAYDADGNFVKGTCDSTTMERDGKGRLMKYDNTNMAWDEFSDLDIEHFFEYEFGYDDQNRVNREEIGGWEWTETYYYTYDGKKVYPASATFESYSEGWCEEGTIQFEYTALDDKGNWTERIETITLTGYEDGDKDNATTTTEVIKQNRRFVYWAE